MSVYDSDISSDQKGIDIKMIKDDKILSANAERWNYSKIQEILLLAETQFFEVAEPVRNQDYNTLLNENFASAVVYAREISSLLYHGFQDGAMTLAGKLYESMILLCFFEKYKEDGDLVSRYFEDRKIKALSDSISLYTFLETGAENNEIRSEISQMNAERKRTYIQYVKKYEKIIPDAKFKPYWWIADLLPVRSFGAIHRQSVWYNSIFRHIYEMISERNHAGTFLEDGGSFPANKETETDGYPLPVCFFLTAFENICHIVFSNYEIDSSEIKQRVQQIVTPMFSEIWK